MSKPQKQSNIAKALRRPQRRIASRNSNRAAELLTLERLEARNLMAGLPNLIDVVSGAGASVPTWFTNVNNTVFFSAQDGSSGNELWKTDGTLGGTSRVKDLLPGANSGNPGYLTNVNGTLFFSAEVVGQGHELWKSDGTEAGTVQIGDIPNSFLTGQAPSHANVNGSLFFTVHTNAGYDLWISNGTSASAAAASVSTA